MGLFSALAGLRSAHLPPPGVRRLQVVSRSVEVEAPGVASANREVTVRPAVDAALDAGVGETLALFERRLPANEQPELIDVAAWDGLPADPRPQRSRFDTTSGGSSEGTGTPETKRAPSHGLPNFARRQTSIRRLLRGVPDPAPA